MKRFITALLTLTLTLSTFAPVSAANTVNVSIDGQAQNYQVPPQIINGRTMLPLRAVGESLGMTVNYDQSTQTATLTKADTTVIHKIGTSTITVNGLSSSFDTPSTIIDSRTLVPLRMLAEAIGADVQWVAATNTAVITTAAATKTEPEQPAPRPEPTGDQYYVGDVLYDPSLLTSYGSYQVTTPEQASLFFADLLKKSSFTLTVDPDEPTKYQSIDFDFNLVPLPHDWTWRIYLKVENAFETNTDKLGSVANSGKVAIGTTKIENGHYKAHIVPGEFDEATQVTPEIREKYSAEVIAKTIALSKAEYRLFGNISIQAQIINGSANTVMKVEHNVTANKTTAYYYDNRIGADATKHIIPAPNFITIK